MGGQRMFQTATRDHQTDLQIEEHYTLTPPVSPITSLPSASFAPRIRDLSDHRLFCFEKSADYGGLKPVIGCRIHVKTVRQHWD
jgi:TnpA family transposase